MADAAIILAAGKGTRMNSELPKVAHEASGRPLITYVLDAARMAGAQRLILVVGFRHEIVRELLAEYPNVEFVLQEEQLGTGHAVMMARRQLSEIPGSVFVLNGDMPLIRANSLEALKSSRENHAASCVVGTAITSHNKGLGRIVRNTEGEFLRIVEERDATPEEKAITEINTGCFVFNAPDLLTALDEIRPENEQAEYYLTDCAAILRSQGKVVRAEPCFEIQEALGVNTPDQLAEVERVLAER